MRNYIFLWLFSISSVGLSQSVNNQETNQFVIKRTSEKIVIDGKLDEQVWADTESIGDFTYSFPVDDKLVEKEKQTEVRMTYNDKFIYISAVCYGDEAIIMPSLKRDAGEFWDGDMFGFVIDPVNEKTNGFGFYTNSAGVQFDVLIGANTGTRGGSGGGSGFNSAWDNKWVTNSSVQGTKWITEMAIPFKSLKYGSKQEWGINFLRGMPSNNSWQTWAPVPVQFNGPDLGFLGLMSWEEEPPKSKSNVSVIPYALTSTYADKEEGLPTENKFRVGGDAKIAVTSKLNLDVTFNPDFSQVDVDEQVTNLTTVNIRFPERRLFFLENADIFSEFGIPPMRPFFSRRIGLDDDGNAIPILYGARLSGNVNSDLRIGVSNLQTGQTDEFESQNYTSVAFNQRIFGRTLVKGYLHNRQAYIDNEFSTIDYNRSLGGEVEYRSIDGALRINGGGGLSLSNGVDDKNYTYHGLVSWNNRNWATYINLMVVGDNYIPDMGFMSNIFHYDAVTEETHRLGYGHLFYRASYSFYPENSFVIKHGPGFRYRMNFTEFDKNPFNRNFMPAYSMEFRNTSAIEVEFNFNKNELLYPFAFTDGERLVVGDYLSNFVGITYQSDQRKNLAYEIGLENGTFYGGRRIQYSADIRYRQQPWGNFGLRFVRNELEFEAPYGSTSLTLFGPKLEFNFSRNLFWTSFLQYNTQSDNFNINSRLQWQFKPLSNIFLVYSENYMIEQWGPKNRAIVLKMNYWINL